MGHAYMITYFGGDGEGQIVAGSVNLGTAEPLKIDSAEDLESLRAKMIKVKRELTGKNFGIMGIIPLHKEL